MKRKYYTLEEANAVLPKVKEFAGQIREAEDARQTKQDEFSRITHAIAQNGGNIPHDHLLRLSKSIERATARVQQLVDALQQKFKCEIKGLQPLLVDFYALREGREVYLCWREGEDDIEHWHDLDAGFAGRQPI